MARIYKIWFWVRRIVAFPFMVAGNFFTLFVVNLAFYFYQPQQWVPFFFVSSVVCGLAYWLNVTVRPPPSLSLRGQLERKKDIKPGVASVVVKRGGSTPSLAAITRRLPKGLRDAAAGPVNRVPEAIAFEQRLIVRRAAERAEDASEPADKA